MVISLKSHSIHKIQILTLMKQKSIQSTTRFAKWDSDCFFKLQPTTKNTAPYIRFFDVNADGYRTATTKHRAVSIFLNNQKLCLESILNGKIRPYRTYCNFN